MSNAYYAVKCLICDESIRLTEREAFMVSKGKDIIRVCDKCKDAVKRMRNEETLKIPRDPDYGTVKINFKEVKPNGSSSQDRVSGYI